MYVDTAETTDYEAYISSLKFLFQEEAHNQVNQILKYQIIPYTHICDSFLKWKRF